MALQVLSNVFTSFILGLLTPLTALCVLPLFPAFLAYLSGKLKSKKAEKNKRVLILFGLVMAAGVILFMFLLGLLFTTILQASLTRVIRIVSPIAFGILVIIGLLLIFDIDVGKIFPKVKVPGIKNPLLNVFVFGFFFGAIVIPCNPLFIAALFARSLSVANFFLNILNFLFFGVGIAAPLLVFSAISTAASGAIINFLTKYRRKINLLVGILLVGVSLYYLIFVFRIFG